MSGRIEDRLRSLGITLPEAAAPAANYVPFVRTGNLLFVSGQLPFEGGQIACAGILGAGVTATEGSDGARLCALHLLAQAKAATGNLDRIARVVRLGGFVASSEDFIEQSRVINGASDLMVEVFGETGRHARVAIGVNILPLGAAVEVEGLFELA